MLIHGEDIPVSYDRFRHRLMIPITDGKDRPIAFGGRVLDPEQKPKYLNSPETPLFHKGSQLFNLAKARPAAHTTGTLIVVEGYMDVIALDQGGFAHAVAPLGTALTADQVTLLWRFVDEPIMCFDGDAAGRKAAFRAIDTCLPMLVPGKSFRFAFMPDGLDPDDLIRQEGPAAMTSVLTAARPLFDVVWDRELAADDWSTPERRAQLEKRLTSLAASIADTSVQSHYGRLMRERLWQHWRQRPVGKVAGKSGGHSQTGRSANRGRPDPRQRESADMTESTKASALGRGAADQWSPREVIILRTILTHPALIDDWAEEIAQVSLQSPDLAELRDKVLLLHAAMAPLQRETLAEQLQRSSLAPTLERIDRTTTHQSEGFLQADATIDVVDEGWRHLLQLQEIAELQRALESTEVTEETWDTIRQLKQRLAELGAS
jgi:DNA primase